MAQRLASTHIPDVLFRCLNGPGESLEVFIATGGFWRPFVHQVELLSSGHFPRLMDVPLPGARDSVQLKEKIHVPYPKSIDVKPTGGVEQESAL